VSTILTLN